MNTILQALTRHNNPLLVLLGITPYRVVPADTRYQPSPPVMTMDHIDSLLQNGVEIGLFTGDEAGVLHTQAIAAGLPVDTRALIIRALDQQVEEALDSLSFRMCEKEVCATLPGLGHGHVYLGEEQVTDSINSIKGLFEVLQELVIEEEPICTSEQGLLLLRQARELDLPLDQAEREERYAALPEETKLAYQQRRDELKRRAIEELGVRFSEINVGGMRGMLIELNMGMPSEDKESPTAPNATPPSFFERLFGRRGR